MSNDFMKKWESMTTVERNQFIADGVELEHRRRYEYALSFADAAGPDWNKLTDNQREKIREQNREHDHRMQNLGEEIRNTLNGETK